MIITRLLAVLSLLACSISAFANTTNPTAFTPAQQTQIQTIVHDYLLNNPQLVMEMVQKLQQGKIQQAVSENSQALFFAPTSPVIGNPKGNVTLVEFLDYQCPHCKHVDPLVSQLLSSDANLRVVFKELPIFGEPSEFAARAALAAALQGKYAALHNALIQAKAPFTDVQLLGIAKTVGLDVSKLQADMSSAAITQELKNNRQLADALNLPGTPAFVIVSTPETATATPTRILFIPGDTDFKTLKKNVAAARK